MAGKPRLLFYCQHVLGMGHFTRSVEIVRGLSACFDVCFLNGGDVVEGFDLPAAVEFVDLPAIKSDAGFRDIETAGTTLGLEAVKQIRKARILEACDRIRPDVAVIELFPFGRRKFAFELVPMLERLRGRGTTIACSLRDILVSKRDQARFEDQTCRLANQYFDLLLIHSDPRFQRLEETFGSAGQLTCAIEYTGFVAQAPPPPRTREDWRPVIVVSVGGGRVGSELVECAIQASAELGARLPHRMLAFAGPYAGDEEWGRAQALAAGLPSVILERYSPRFIEHLADADLSISMAGYNTCMNILATRVRALVHPFAGNNNEEQTLRARKLEELGALSVLSAEELTPAGLARKILETLARPAAEHAFALDANGVARTAELLGAAAREVVS